MIKAIEIQNFQSHQHSVLDFAPGVNIIKGTSDNGKSSIIRAILWAGKNQPLGFAFKSKFAPKEETTRVAIEFSDDKWIVRERGEGINQYLTSECEDPFKAFNTEPPKEVSDLLNFGDHNIQGQHDGYFLLQSSSGEVARLFNRIVGLDIIDSSTKKISSIVDRTKASVTNAQETIKKLKEELKQYDFLPALEKDMDKLETLLKEREMQRQQRTELLGITHRIDEIDEEIKDWDSWLDVEKEAQDLITLAQETSQVIRERDTIKGVIDRIEELGKEILYWQDEVDSFEFAEKLAVEVQECRKGIKEKGFIDSELIRLQDIENEIENFENKIEQLEKERKDLGILCPNCGYDMSEKL